ncbi:MAG: hypothetical protein KJ025_21080 [Burkholderiales bacterium]|nr:hypothetical protein [Burkholderiales bacterium]
MRHPIRNTLAAALLAAAALPAAAQTAAPALKSGDTWNYRLTNLYNHADLGIVTRAVTAAGANELRIATGAAEGQARHEERYSGPGSLAAGTLSDRAEGPLTPALTLAPFPLREGERWTQKVVRDDAASREKRETLIQGKVVGWETVKVPAGEFRALRIERRIDLGDFDPFRGPTLRWETEWYAPDVKGAVKLQVIEEYFENRYNRMQSPLPGTRSLYELVSYKAG